MNTTSLKVGQVLWLKVRYQIDMVALEKHPMLIADIKDDYIEIIALDKTAGKMENLYLPYNFYINCDDPKEVVIFEDSYAQMNTKLTIDNFSELLKSRNTDKCLSDKKLKCLIESYNEYQENNRVREERIVHMSKEEIMYLNSNLVEEIVSCC